MLWWEGGGTCAFFLNNNVTTLAMALPWLENLSLRPPCPKNICLTTVTCLPSITTYCIKLQKLEIHINTTNIVDNLQRISSSWWLQELGLLPRCPLSCLVIDLTMLLDDNGFEMVVDGIRDSFPSFESFTRVWGQGQYLT